jgi:nucleoside-diphosphate-sugar epimerase
MTDLYALLLKLPDYKVNKKTWNAGYHNYKVKEIADIVRKVINPRIQIKTEPTEDLRSYHVSSEKIRKDIGFVARYGIEKAVMDLQTAFESGWIPNAMEDPRYYNIKMMQGLNLK